MKRSYKFQIRPTTRQARSLAACVEDHRQLYNGAREERREAYRMRRVSISYGSQSAQLKEIRDIDSAGQGRWSFSSQQATLRRLDKSFAAFFRRVKAHQTPGYPRFKGRGWLDTVQWPKDRDGCRWDSQPNQPAARVYLQGVPLPVVRLSRARGHERGHEYRCEGWIGPSGCASSLRSLRLQS